MSIQARTKRGKRSSASTCVVLNPLTGPPPPHYIPHQAAAPRIPSTPQADPAPKKRTGDVLNDEVRGLQLLLQQRPHPLLPLRRLGRLRVPGPARQQPPLDLQEGGGSPLLLLLVMLVMLVVLQVGCGGDGGCTRSSGAGGRGGRGGGHRGQEPTQHPVVAVCVSVQLGNQSIDRRVQSQSTNCQAGTCVIVSRRLRSFDSIRWGRCRPNQRAMARLFTPSIHCIRITI